MRKFEVGKVWIPALILAVVMAGCSDPDKVASSPFTSPAVPFVTPPALSTVACPNPAIVSATFSKAMNAATINTSTFTLTGPGGAVAGTVNYVVATQIAIFTPSITLPSNTPFTATISAGVTDTFGNMLGADFVWKFTTSAPCSPPPPVGPPLASICGFGILAGSTVTNTGPTAITGGNIGLSPGSAVTGFPPGTLVTPGVMHVTDSVAAQAQVDLTAAYNNAAGATGTPTNVLPGDMSGLTFTPGVWKNASTVMLSAGNVTLDAQGNSGGVFIFQMGTTLTTGSSTQVILAGGALAKNIFWQVGSSATLGTNSIFKGTIMAQDSIALTTGASLEGRALARTGAVTLDNNAVAVSPCP
jgi:hypothetical protein